FAKADGILAVFTFTDNFQLGVAFEQHSDSGPDNSSFCSNSACHGVNWRYAGFNAPGLATMMGIYQVVPEQILEDFNDQPTYAVQQPLFTQVCGGCYGPVPQKGLRLTDYASLMAGSVDGPVVTPG